LSARIMRSVPGDKPVDDVDNSGTPPRGPDSAGHTAEPSDMTGLSGADLARAALESAKQAAKARGRMPAKRRTGIRRGGPRRRTGWSGARPDERDPQPLGRLAARIAIDRGWAEHLSGGAVFGRWAELVGPEIAEHAKPVSLRDGELTVQAVSTSWATQLRLLQRDLLARIAAGAGRGVVTRLRIHGPVAPSWRYGSRHVPGRGPRDTYG
jgi:predicted nucleic acid-binding Zn ribbon protein